MMIGVLLQQRHTVLSRVPHISLIYKNDILSLYKCNTVKPVWTCSSTLLLLAHFTIVLAMYFLGGFSRTLEIRSVVLFGIEHHSYFTVDSTVVKSTDMWFGSMELK